MNVNRALIVACLALPAALSFSTTSLAQPVAEPEATPVTADPATVYEVLVSPYFGEARRGADRALLDLAQGVVQHVAIGEQAPPQHRDRDGLPLGSLGCEYEEGLDEFARGYNAVVDAVVARQLPFAGAGTVEIHAGDQVMTVHHDQITRGDDVVQSEIHQRAGLVYLADSLIQVTDDTQCAADPEWRTVIGDEAACWTAGDPTFAALQALSQTLFDVPSGD